MQDVPFRNQLFTFQTRLYRSRCSGTIGYGDGFPVTPIYPYLEDRSISRTALVEQDEIVVERIKYLYDNSF